jgi:hypothetical protein
MEERSCWRRWLAGGIRRRKQVRCGGVVVGCRTTARGKASTPPACELEEDDNHLRSGTGWKVVWATEKVREGGGLLGLEEMGFGQGEKERGQREERAQG